MYDFRDYLHLVDEITKLDNRLMSIAENSFSSVPTEQIVNRMVNIIKRKQYLLNQYQKAAKDFKSLDKIDRLIIYYAYVKRLTANQIADKLDLNYRTIIRIANKHELKFAEIKERQC